MSLDFRSVVVFGILASIVVQYTPDQDTTDVYCFTRYQTDKEKYTTLHHEVMIKLQNY